MAQPLRIMSLHALAYCERLFYLEEVEETRVADERVYAGRRRNFVGRHLWARGYWVSTVGKNEAAVRRYIQDQEQEDKRLEQLELAAL